MSTKSNTRIIVYLLAFAFLLAVTCLLYLLTGPYIGNTFSSINNSLPGDPTAIALPTFGPADSLTSVDDILNQALSSSLAYNAPDAMQLDEAIIIELLLNPSVSEEELGQQIEESGEVVTGTVQITPLMKAELKAQEEAFDILPLHDSPEQPISATESTRWQWQVTAKKEGAQRLTLVVYMLVKYEGKEYWREVETYRNDILVNVSLGQRLGRFDWKWLVGLIVASGLVPFVWAWFKKRRAARKSTASK